MASTLLPTKMEGTQGLEVGSRTWVACVLHVTYLSWGTMCVAKINRLLSVRWDPVCCRAEAG